MWLADCSLYLERTCKQLDESCLSQSRRGGKDSNLRAVLLLAPQDETSRAFAGSPSGLRLSTPEPER